MGKNIWKKKNNLKNIVLEIEISCMIPIDYQIEIKREFMKYNILKIVQNSTWGDKEMTI